ncbi:HAD family hydrolase [Hyphococcus sp.]|jgi:HAD superfamily hydrolase (TIGR01509 family)|uniref:HAD family hydrolase n=1 Tax=Hyphococcus sp. TaxID=2038636 RepID=UPI003D0C4164
MTPIKGKNFDAIIFDCDGVLVDSEVLAIRGERAALETLGLFYSPQDYVRKFVGLHDRSFFDALRMDYREIHGRDAPHDFEDFILEERRRERHLLTSIAGADAAIKKARDYANAVGVASSSRAHFLQSKLERTGLFELAAPHVYSADLVTNGKPAPDIFLYAAERIGAEPERCLVLEDSENGVRAGIAAGMTVWGFLGGGHIFEGHGERLTAAGAASLVESFAAFAEALDALHRNAGELRS